MSTPALRTVLVHQDVPRKLLELICALRYDRLTPEEGRTRMGQLAEFIDSKRVLPRRTTPIASVQISIPNHVPDEAIAFANGYDYSGISSLQIGMAMPIVKRYLKSQGLLA
jgi:hypothetical protein